MSLYIQKNADFSQSGLGIVMPAAGIDAYGVFGGSLTESLKNNAYDQPAFTAQKSGTGSLVVGSNYVETKSVTDGAWIDTGVPEADEWTVFFVGKSLSEENTSSGRAFFMGNYGRDGGNGQGFGLFASSNSQVQLLLSDENDTSISAVRTVGDVKSPIALAARLKNGVITLRDLIGETESNVNDTRVNPQKGVENNIRVGGSGNATFIYGESAMSMAVVASRGLSDSEIRNTWTQMRATMVRRGVLSE